MKQVYQGRTIVLPARFQDNGVVFDPYVVSSCQILNPAGSVVATISPTQTSTGEFHVAYPTATTATVSDKWKVRWRWQATSTMAATTQDFYFQVLAATVAPGVKHLALTTTPTRYRIPISGRGDTLRIKLDNKDSVGWVKINKLEVEFVTPRVLKK